MAGPGQTRAPREAQGADARAPNGWPAALLRGFRDGDRAALREVYQMHADDVARQLRFGFSFESRGRPQRFAGYHSPFDFHDALHETFRRAFEPRARQQYDGIRPYAPYLRTIARNVVLRTFRAQRNLFPVADAEGEGIEARTAAEDPTPEQAVGSRQLEALVAQFVDTLGEAERRLLTVRFVDGKSQRDAAEILGLGRQQIRGREAKLRLKLVKYLRTQGEAGLILGGASALMVMHALVEVLR